ncbi:hypothetical protein PsYK624_165810 [Phanerochaete sordida]|uniref:Uncharacterized protein n=1 Tax=Phanerochaete sordida TaxID=48140 RepID=A0A9P3GSC4_9APHY|nr:hypothetical protein PsYK624_165810 [Phanerochaete sordida]
MRSARAVEAWQYVGPYALILITLEMQIFYWRKQPVARNSLKVPAGVALSFASHAVDVCACDPLLREGVLCSSTSIGVKLVRSEIARKRRHSYGGRSESMAWKLRPEARADVWVRSSSP